MVAQTFSWEEQMAALSLGNQTANFATIENSEEENVAEEKIKELQFAYMAFTSPDSSEVCFKPCSLNCNEKIEMYKLHNDNLIRDMERVKSESFKLKKNEKGFVDKIESLNKDIKKLKSDFSIKSCHHLDAKQEIAELTTNWKPQNVKFWI